MTQCFRFDDLIAYVTETATENIDVHVRPQWSCCGAGRIPFEMVGRVESLDRDVPAFIEAGLIAPEKLARLEVRNATSAPEPINDFETVTIAIY